MQIIGFVIVLFLSALVIMMTGDIFSSPEIKQIFNSVPWITKLNFDYIKYGVMGFMILVAISIPAQLMLRDAKDGGERLETVGFAGVAVGRTIATVALVILAVIAAGYFFGVGLEMRN